MSKISGSCLCKEVRFEADSIRGPGSACHCIMCQKSHGGPFGAYVTLDGFRWISGEDQITSFQSSEHCTRSFCSRCGTTLQFYDTRKPDIASLAVSALDGDHDATIGSHIYVNTRVDWHPILDDLPQFSESI
ncbi:MAG: GFA family protein [Arenicellales bacterium]